MNEKKKFKYGIIYASIPVSIMIMSKLTEYLLNYSFVEWGILPRTFTGLRGVLFAPFIHASFLHLYSNIISLFILLTATYYFYRKIAYEILFVSFIVVELIVWFIGRYSYHIGSSGQVYFFASFLFFTGLFAKNRASLAISFIMIFLYGSMIWGIFPNNNEISWESHLSGGFIGLLTAAFAYNKSDFANKKSISKPEDFSVISTTDTTVTICYEYKNKDN